MTLASNLSTSASQASDTRRIEAFLEMMLTVEAGILNVDIGISPSRPAEFIMFRLGLTAASGDEADA